MDSLRRTASLKSIAIIIFTIGLFQSCQGQTKNQEKEMEELINEISSQVIQYKEQPSYHAEVNSSACSFQLLINDMPAVNHYSRGGVSVSMPVNSLILKSGKQTFTLRLYPGYYKEGKELKQVETLVAETKLNFKINVKHWNDSNKESKDVFAFSLPGKENTNGVKEFSFSGQKYYEFTGEFNADVPYSITGWSNSQKFDIRDSAILEKQAEEYYLKMGDLIKKKNFLAYFKLRKKSIIEISQAMYQTKEEIRNSLNEKIKKWSNPSFKMQPFEKYELKFYGNNRVLSLERTDLPNKGEPSLRAEYTNEDNEERVTAIGFNLHLPAKSRELEIL